MVIQRWQSLLLLVAAVMMGCFTFMSLGQVQTEDFSFNFNSLGFHYEGESADYAPSHTYLSTWYFFILSLSTTLVLLIDIFLYNNLVFQKKVCSVGILMTIASIATAVTLGYTAIEGYSVSWSSIAFCPIIALVGSILALNRMQSDHNKLKSVDRLR